MLTDAKREEVERFKDRLIDEGAVLAIVPMGGGKTMTSATAAVELKAEGLIDKIWVFAPKRVARNVWPTDLHLWQHLQHLRVSCLVGTPEQRLKALNTDADVYVINFDNVMWLKTALKKSKGKIPANSYVIIDEIGRLRNATGKQAKTVAKIISDTKYRVGMTGTPKPKSQLGYFMQMRLVKGEEVWPGSFTDWREKYFETVDYDGHQWEPKAGHDELLDLEFARAAYVVTDEEMGAAKVHANIHPLMVDLPPAARIAHDTALKKWMLSLPEHKVKNLLESAAVGSGKARQIASGFVYDENGQSHQVHTAKLELIEDIAADLTEPAIYAYAFLPELEALQRMFPKARVLGGGVSDKEADRTVEMWKAGDLDQLLLHPASAGHGLNIQSGGRYIYWFTPPWDLELWRQTNARLARQGQKKQVTAFPLIAKGTIEETLVWPRLIDRGVSEDELKALIKRVQKTR